MTAVQTPLIGLTIYREIAQWGAWKQTADLLPATYAVEVRAAGGLPVLLPAATEREQLNAEAQTVVQRTDGIVLTGGGDVEPARYSSARHPTTDAPRPDRDAWEIALVHAARAAGRPLLGVCRGLQVLNVALGGTLIQHLPDGSGAGRHRGAVGSFVHHPVRLAGGCALAGIYGPTASVASHHHQAIADVADGLEPVGWAEDGVVEAVTGTGPVWTTGVQWHPEVGDGQGLFAAFVTACVEALDRRAAPAASAVSRP